MDLELSDKRAIVTGGSRGLGKTIAWQLAAEGVSVAIAARNADVLNAAAAEIMGATGSQVVPLVVDMGDDASVDAMVASGVEALGGADILINNAATPGGGASANVQEISIERLLSDINIKTGGYLRAARAVSPHMIAKGWGRIISIGGMAARVTGNYNAGIRCASVSTLTKNLADELGPKGISAIAIHPHLLSCCRSDGR
ncbi:SDR family NAD(P)-dependent oxidoreductase [Sphingosinicella rhizophila]|uniref:SDR family NAD(P)-dependent oxidoreductase n=1 Tax=Sphingosinicella rhizophila TaxID=3050082 RepID=A0ABU3QCF4_9SPHN|nr:SDR family NAD(P)-dependent oxidoreductase [Sphingosinicella sp. GR2756]MDT9601083.1 SDR family NAD(P)-dependent oxidoreductase [Sphingosinicella sp. GR2756]